MKLAKSIIIVPAGKGRVTMKKGRADCVSKVNILMEDKKYYAVLSSDPVSSITNSTNKLLDKLRCQKMITPGGIETSLTDNHSDGTMYGRPKVHKHVTPLRPIVHCVAPPCLD